MTLTSSKDWHRLYFRADHNFKCHIVNTHHQLRWSKNCRYEFSRNTFVL